VVLVAGIAWVAETATKVEKQAVSIHMTLPSGTHGIRLDIQQRGAPGAARSARLIEHLEWSYPAQSPPAQDAELELLPGNYAVTTHLLGAGRDPSPVDLDFAQGSKARLTIDLRNP
jgi:hypothetical protein